MTKKRMSPEEIPGMIEQVLPIWQKEIDRMQEEPELTPADLKMSLQLVQAMTMIYTSYRVLKEQVKAETNKLTPQQILNSVKEKWSVPQIAPKKDN